jgi:NitT/TauT family transport system permease protein
MTVQDTRAVPGLDLARDQPKPTSIKAVRRLPVQKDWPGWVIITIQIGILVGVIALWQVSADRGWIDGFFWSKPSAIYATLIKFFTEGDAWTDIAFTFRSTIFGFLIGTTAGSLIGLSFWWSRNYAAVVQPYIICFESLPKLALAPLVILVFGLGLVSKVAIATALHAGVPQAGRTVLSAVDHFGAAGEHRSGADRRHRRRIHRVPTRPRTADPLCRPDL